MHPIRPRLDLCPSDRNLVGLLTSQSPQGSDKNVLRSRSKVWTANCRPWTTGLLFSISLIRCTSAQRSCISGNKYSLDQDQANKCRSSQATCASAQLQKLTTGMPMGEPDRGSLGSYLAHKDQRFPEFCLANGTDVTCLTALLAGGTNSVGLSGRGAKKPQCQRV